MSNTGLISDGCYASPLKDCDGEKPTREHYFTTGVLKSLGKSLPISGLCSLRNSREREPIAIKSLFGYVLCGKHNHIVSEYDGEATKLIKVLRDIRCGNTSVSESFNGHFIERWMAKVLFGLVASNQLPIWDTPYSGKPQIEALEWLFGSRQCFSNYGLHVLDLSRSQQFVPKKEMKVMPYSGHGSKTIKGIFVTMLRLGLVMDSSDFTPPEQEMQYAFRPKHLIIKNHGVITLTWNDGTSQNQDMELDLTPPKKTL